MLEYRKEGTVGMIGKKVIFTFCLLLSLYVALLISCATTGKTEDYSFTEQATLDTLCGKWIAADGSSFEYPFIHDGKKYILYHVNTTDDTSKWQLYASQNYMLLSDVWEKRYSCMQKVYKSLVCFPSADEQGLEYGIRIQKVGDKIYGNEEYLIPERLLAVNTIFFTQTKDRTKLTTTGIFHLTSNKFADFSAKEGNVYEKN